MNIDKLASWLLRGLMGVSILVFLLFFLIGYNIPYEENPNMNNPLLTDAVIILCILYTVVAVAATIWSAFQKGVQGSSSSRESGLIGRTGLVSGGLLVASIVIGVIVGIINQNETLLINGESWNNPLDIIITDASIISIIILLVVTVAALIYSMVVRVKK
jgi:hypothetical protein